MRLATLLIASFVVLFLERDAFFGIAFIIAFLFSIMGVLITFELVLRMLIRVHELRLLKTNRPDTIDT